MAKFFGKIGYAVSKDVRPGVWDGEITEREYFGDLIRNTSRYQTSDKLNDDINISNEISIVADPFAYQNFHAMRYVEFMGEKWKISSVEVQYPRLILTVGGSVKESRGQPINGALNQAVINDNFRKSRLLNDN
jgi:hypothetical protein